MPTRDRSQSSVESLALLWAARESGVIDALTTSAGTAEAVAGFDGCTVRDVPGTDLQAVVGERAVD